MKLLPTVTLCAVDTRTPALALAALQRSMQQLRYARVLLCSDVARDVPAGIDSIAIGPIASSADYSDFMLRRLLDYIATPHVLVVQWDGFVADAGRWEDGFLTTDYIGAPWGRAAHGFRVGNGGFSLRSRRLLEALRDPVFADRLHHPEDVCIAQTLRPLLESRHAIRYATLEQAQRFAFENEDRTTSAFGFHGAHNLPRVLGADAFGALLDALPAGAVAGRDGFKLARTLLREGQPQLAARLLRRRRLLGGTDLRSRLLALRARLAGG